MDIFLPKASLFANFCTAFYKYFLLEVLSDFSVIFYSRPLIKDGRFSKQLSDLILLEALKRIAF